MKIIDREYLPQKGNSYSPRWLLRLECGHDRVIGKSNGNQFVRAEITKVMNCEVCEKPAPPKLRQDLEKIADACRKYGW